MTCVNLLALIDPLLGVYELLVPSQSGSVDIGFRALITLEIFFLEVARVDVRCEIAFVEENSFAKAANVLHRLLRQHLSLVLRDVVPAQPPLRCQMFPAELANPIFLGLRWLLLLSLLAAARILLVILKAGFCLEHSITTLAFLVIRFAGLRQMVILHHVFPNKLPLAVLAIPDLLPGVNLPIVVHEIVTTLEDVAAPLALEVARPFRYQVSSLHVNHEDRPPLDHKRAEVARVLDLQIRNQSFALLLGCGSLAFVALQVRNGNRPQAAVAHHEIFDLMHLLVPVVIPRKLIN